MKNKLFAISTALLMVVSLAACSPVVEKEQPKTPGEIVSEQEPISVDTEGIEVSEEYVDEAVALVTYAVNTFYTKNDEFTNEMRREAVKDIIHPLFVDEIEELQVLFDATSEIEITNLVIGEAYILDGVTSKTVPELEKQSAFQVEFKVEYKTSEGLSSDEAHALLFVDNGELKLASFYNN